ncbi:hypothetical protein MON38_22335 [Hymenobacter sp. DH14]|uniref:Uncharacterized protein n=1 Tax=Hymenobacter cyanobacteriorum TaxID=2926463 RepID=A0A9X1VJ53_9BACT|nr:hypothetical protein [Hymenobacter cyanobacteriorum]MCI1190174.1 hypothetical protein [Hymenobacter cyanobacteriorum]
MKQLLFALLLLAASLRSLGQTTTAAPELEAPLTGFADAINTVFQSVDKNRVPSGLLEE